MKSTFLRDALERIIATFVEAFAGVMIAAEYLGVGPLKAAVAAGITAALAVVKAIAAKYTGNPGTASLVDATVPRPRRRRTSTTTRKKA